MERRPVSARSWIDPSDRDLWFTAILWEILVTRLASLDEWVDGNLKSLRMYESRYCVCVRLRVCIFFVVFVRESARALTFQMSHTKY